MTKSFVILPAIDLLDGEVVRLQRGERELKTVYSDDPAATARRWQGDGATALHVVDLNGAFEGVPSNLDSIRAIRDAFGGFIEVGGGLRTAEAVAALLEIGIDCAILGTAALEDKDLLKQLLDEHGADRLAAGVDGRDGKVAVRGWTETGSVDALDLLEELEALGVRRAIFTDIATDGMLTGPNLEATAAAARHVPKVTIIVSGGVSTTTDVAASAALPEANIGGVISGKALYDGRLNLPDALRYERRD